MKFKIAAGAPEGTVLLFGIRYWDNPKVFTYAMLKADGLWYVTGGSSQVPTAAGWGAVERWLEKDGRVVEWVRIVIETEQVWPEPASPVEPTEADHMGEIASEEHEPPR